tara:strand:+ start:257 stop:790 length:534 start_codon:yes stop_codon:yes gene_type:complete
LSSRIDVDEIRSKTTNGNLTFQPNGTGMLVPQRPVAFQVGATDIDQSGSADSSSIVQWEFVTLDTGGYWDSTNHRYTPQVAGFYLFGGVVRFATSPGQYANTKLRKNGSNQSSIQINSGSSSNNIIGNSSISIPTMMVQMNGSSDYVDVAFASENASTISDTNSIPSVFWGLLVHGT